MKLTGSRAAGLAALCLFAGLTACEDESPDVGLVDPEEAREERRELKEEIEEQNEGEGAIEAPEDDEELELIDEEP